MIDSYPITLVVVGALLALLALGISLYGAARQRNAEQMLTERQHQADTINATLLAKFNGTVNELAQVRELLSASAGELTRIRAQLEAALNELARLRPALDAATTEILRLRTALDAANLEIAQLRTTIITKTLPVRAYKPLLLFQCEPKFGETDAQALRRTGIPFQRRRNCTAQDFDNALQTGREDDMVPQWIQISAHMNAEFIKFFDEEKGIAWLSQRIRGVEVLFLAGCENDEIGAALVGSNIARHIVTLLEPVEDRDAGNFTFAFWRAIGEGNTPPDAFEQALHICPQISEFVQLRSARRPGR